MMVTLVTLGLLLWLKPPDAVAYIHDLPYYILAAKIACFLRKLQLQLSLIDTHGKGRSSYSSTLEASY